MIVDLLVLAVAALFVGFWYAAARALRRWSGIWRWLALAPVAIVGIVAARIAVRPNSHTLWPIELLLWTIVGALLLGLLTVGKTLIRTQRRRKAAI